jgi:hypothetical protein
LLGTATVNGSGVAAFTTSSLGVGSHSLTSVYNGDSDFTGSTSPVDSKSVNQADTAVSLTAAPDPSVFGQSATLTATVSAVAPGAGLPTGAVSFFDGATLIGTAAIDGSGTATFTVSTLSAGSHSLTGVYVGGPNFNGSTSPVDTKTVISADTTVALIASPDPSVFGQPATLTATINAVAPGAGTATGTVSFFDGATLIGTTTVDGSGVATFTTSSLGVGAHALTSVYSGDPNCSASTSPVDVKTVLQADTTVGLAVSPDPSVFGEATIITASVNAVDPGAGVPTGTVSFFDGVTLIGTANVDGSGVATFTTSDLGVGSHSLTGVYSGELDFNGSTSPADTKTVNAADTSVGLTAAPDPSVFGEPATITATVSAVDPGAGTPTGTVNFFDGATLLGTAVVDGSGVATFTTSALGVGSHPLTGVYSGDLDFNESTSPADTKTVVNADTTVTLTAAPDPSVFGQAATLTATVNSAAPGAGLPTGTVSFFDGTTLLGTATLDGLGVATFTTSALNAGSHALSGAYNGDPTFNASTSPVDSNTVAKDSTLVALIASPDPSVFGQAATLTATVNAVAPGAGIPTGTVSFFDGESLIGTATLNGSGVATLTSSVLSAGSHSLTSVYNGDPNFNGSTSPIDTKTVVKDSTTVSLTVGPSPSIFGQPATLTANVNAVAPGAGIPTGTVSFFDGATLLGTAALNGSGVATFTTSSLSAGPHALTGVYAGSGNFNGGTSTVVGQTVNQATSITSVDHGTVSTGVAASFTITTAGYPVAEFTLGGALPNGLSFHDNGDGTAAIAGTPADATGGVYSLTINASNGTGGAARQIFKLTVNQSPAITGDVAATFPVGMANSFTFRTTGFPAPVLNLVGTLPAGLTFNDNGNGTATIAGTPTANTGADYNLTIIARNGTLSDASRDFTLTVVDGPAVQTDTFAVVPTPAPIGGKSTGSSVQLGLNQPISATPPTSAFSLFQGDGFRASNMTTSNQLGITGVTYDPNTQSISVQTRKPIKGNRFYILTANAAAIHGTNGTLLDGTGNGDAGTPLRLRFGMGRSLSYIDSNGNRVILKLSGPGWMVLIRQPNGQGDKLMITGATAGTTLTGSVRKGLARKAVTTLASISGLGQGRDLLPTGQFSVALVSKARLR